MSVRLSCPSCNTTFGLPAIPADRRATCPRCGDVFPVRGFDQETGDSRQETESNQQEPLPTPLATPHSPASKTTNRFAVGLVILGLLAVGIGLTIYFKGGFQKKEETKPASTQLAGLGYLPADSNIVFAVRLPPILAYAERTGQDPRALLAGAGVPAQVFGTIEQLGLTLQDIDHIAGSTSLGDGEFELRLTVVLVLQSPLADEDEFLQRLKRKSEPGGKPRYRVEVSRVPLPLLLERVSPLVWVFGVDEKDFEAVDHGGYGPGGVQFRDALKRADGTQELTGLRKMISEVPPDAAVWLAADDERDWTQKPAVQLLGQSPDAKKWLPVASSGRGGLFALSFADQPRMKLVVRTADTATADRVRTYFQTRAAETPSATTGGEDTFAFYDAPFDPATGWKTLQQFLADAAR